MYDKTLIPGSDELFTKLMNERGIKDLEPEVMDQIKQDMLESMMTIITMRLMEALPEDKAKELAQEGSEHPMNNHQVLEFLKANIPNMQEILKLGMKEFSLVYLS